MSSASKIPASECTAAGRPVPVAHILGLDPYVQGKCKVENTEDPIKLSSNECCFGPSPKAVTAYQGIASQLHRYADGTQIELRTAIADVHALDHARIVCGNGSEELIGLLTRCFVGFGDELLLSENHFVMCSIYGQSQGADIVLAPEKDYRIDVDAIIDRVTPRTKMIAVANPNNPTGTYLRIDEIDRLVEAVPEHVLVLIDGAYAEYVYADDFDPGTRWVNSSQNVVMTRTFSKIYGLAGMRIGWAYGPSDIVEIVNRLRTPFNASLPAMAAAAASVGDIDHVTRVREHNRHWLERISTELKSMGLGVAPSVANFYLIDFGDRTDKSASEAIAYLESRGIIPRPAGSSNQLRITVGTDRENEAVLTSLRDYSAT